MSESYRPVNLKDARAMTPAVNPVEALRRQLAMGLFNGVKEKDLADMAAKLKEMAMAGDLKAMKLYFDLVLPKEKDPPPPPPKDDSAGLRMMARSLSDLTDEIRISKAHQAKRQKLIGANGAAPIDEEDD
jgi:hypothetical protein